MEKYAKIKMGAFDMYYGYRVFELENQKMFDFVSKIYTKINKWNDYILRDVVINRCPLDEILTVLNRTEEELSVVLFDNVNGNYELMKTVDKAKNKSLITTGFYPESIVNEGCEPKVYLHVNKQDLSSSLDDFGIYKQEAVKKAFILLSKNNYPFDQKDVDGFIASLNENLQESDEPNF